METECPTCSQTLPHLKIWKSGRKRGGASFTNSVNTSVEQTFIGVTVFLAICHVSSHLITPALSRYTKFISSLVLMAWKNNPFQITRLQIKKYIYLILCIRDSDERRFFNLLRPDSWNVSLCVGGIGQSKQYNLQGISYFIYTLVQYILFL